MPEVITYSCCSGSSGLQNSPKVFASASKKGWKIVEIVKIDRQRNIAGVVFDFDGTLAELHLDFAAMKRRIGLLYADICNGAPDGPPQPALEWIESLTADLAARDPFSALAFRARAHALIVDMEIEAAYRGRLFAFTRPILEQLRAAEVRTAIITRNCEKAVRIVFPDVDECCDGFLSRDHVARVKPDPDHLLQALRRIRVAPGAALMVGDHPIDIRTGLLAGVLTAGVFSGNASRAELEQSGAGWVAQSCLELMWRLQSAQLIGTRLDLNEDRRQGV